MTFYGLSQGLWYAEDVTGTAVADNPDSYASIQNHFDDLTLTLHSGDQIIVALYGPEGYGRDPVITDDVAPLAWVLETDASSAGSVTMAAGVRTSSPWADAASCTESLGSFDCTGLITIVAHQTSFDLAGYLDGGPTGNLLITCTSGTVVLKQVKMRVWPTSGASGGWRPGESFTNISGSLGFRHTPVGLWTSHYAPGSYAAVWAEDVSNFDSIEGRTSTVPPETVETIQWQYLSSSAPHYDAYLYANNSVVDIPPYCSGWVSSSSAIFVPDVGTTGSSPEAGIGYDPYEIAWEDQAQLRAAGGGAAVGTVTGWNAVNVQQGNAGSIAMESCAFTPSTTVPFDGAAISAAPTAAIALGAGETRSVTPPGSGPFVITGYPPTYFSAPSGETTDFSNGKFLTNPTVNVLFSGVEVYDPAYVPPAPEVHASPPGYYLIPAPNLDGEGLGVQVHFATS